MTREIKFRGKRVDNGKWAYGHYWCQRDLQSLRDSKHFIIIERIEEYEDDAHQWDVIAPEFVEVDPKTVGQFTGLKDKNGKEIYKGDIVKKTNLKPCGCVGAVAPATLFQSTGFEALCTKHKFEDIGFHSCEMNLFNYKQSLLNVIGNIHDNAELLKE